MPKVRAGLDGEGRVWVGEMALGLPISGKKGRN